MSWRTIVISRSAKLDYQMGYMTVRSANETNQVYLREIRMVLIETTAVSITAALLNEMIHHKIKVIFCDEKRNPSSELMPYYGAFDSSGKIRTQMQWPPEIKKQVWTEIVTEKIRKQADKLERYGRQEATVLRGYIREIKPGDETNREGYAAKVYFNSLFGMGFSRAEDCFENAALNYGYSILLSCFTREITMNGYMTQLGVFHDSQTNPFNLASDLMEPFRPIVDGIVREMELKQFEAKEKLKLVDLQNRKVRINDRDEYIGNAIQIYVRSIFDAINDKDVSEIKFYQHEL